MTAGSERRDVVVVGAGLLGLATAAELARRGRDVVCLERYRVGHDRSGSKGAARIFRLGYTDPLYVALGRRALEGWRRLEAETGSELFVPTGFLSFGDDLDLVRRAMADAGAAPEVMSGGEVAARFPGLRVDGDALFEPGAGVLAADRVLAALRESVPDLREATEVLSLEDAAGSVSVQTATGRLECGVAVLCPGAWSGRLAAAAGLRGVASLSPNWQQIAYFSPHPWAGDLPAFVCRRERTVYGLPQPSFGSGSRPPYKVGIHDPGPVCDPDDLDPGPAGDEIEWLTATVAGLLPGLEPRPCGAERCPYDNSPDADFVLDRVGRIVIGAGTSGHGFKFGPLLGSALADLAEGRRPPLPMERFSLSRAALSAVPPRPGKGPPRPVR